MLRTGWSYEVRLQPQGVMMDRSNIHSYATYVLSILGPSLARAGLPRILKTLEKGVVEESHVDSCLTEIKDGSNTKRISYSSYLKIHCSKSRQGDLKCMEC